MKRLLAFFLLLCPPAIAGGITDYSANKSLAFIPNVGSNFGASGPYANYVLIATVPNNASRRKLDIENTSGAQIAIVRDDGQSATGTAPANATVFALAGAASVGAQGGSYADLTAPNARFAIYAPSSAAIVGIFGE